MDIKRQIDAMFVVVVWLENFGTTNGIVDFNCIVCNTNGGASLRIWLWAMKNVPCVLDEYAILLCLRTCL